MVHYFPKYFTNIIGPMSNNKPRVNKKNIFCFIFDLLKM